MGGGRYDESGLAKNERTFDGSELVVTPKQRRFVSDTTDQPPRGCFRVHSSPRVAGSTARAKRRKLRDAFYADARTLPRRDRAVGNAMGGRRDAGMDRKMRRRVSAAGKMNAVLFVVLVAAAAFVRGATAAVASTSACVCEQVGGTCRLEDLVPRSSTETCDPSALRSDGSLDENIYVQDNAYLADLDLSGLKILGGDLVIERNSYLQTIDASDLRTVSGDFVVSDNDYRFFEKLRLRMLDEVGGDLTITSNTNLGFVSLRFITRIGGAVTVSNNYGAMKLFTPCGTTNGIVDLASSPSYVSVGEQKKCAQCVPRTSDWSSVSLWNFIDPVTGDDCDEYFDEFFERSTGTYHGDLYVPLVVDWNTYHIQFNGLKHVRGRLTVEPVCYSYGGTSNRCTGSANRRDVILKFDTLERVDGQLYIDHSRGGNQYFNIDLRSKCTTQSANDLIQATGAAAGSYIDTSIPFKCNKCTCRGDSSSCNYWDLVEYELDGTCDNPYDWDTRTLAADVIIENNSRMQSLDFYDTEYITGKLHVTGNTVLNWISLGQLQSVGTTLYVDNNCFGDFGCHDLTATVRECADGGPVSFLVSSQYQAQSIFDVAFIQSYDEYGYGGDCSSRQTVFVQGSVALLGYNSGSFGPAEQTAFVDVIANQLGVPSSTVHIMNFYDYYGPEETANGRRRLLQAVVGVKVEFEVRFDTQAEADMYTPTLDALMTTPEDGGNPPLFDALINDGRFPDLTGVEGYSSQTLTYDQRQSGGGGGKAPDAESVLGIMGFSISCAIVIYLAFRHYRRTKQATSVRKLATQFRVATNMQGMPPSPFIAPAPRHPAPPPLRGVPQHLGGAPAPPPTVIYVPAPSNPPNPPSASTSDD